MQQYYRIALGMCLLIGYLQAQPVKRNALFEDLDFDLLNDVSCNQAVFFTSPEDVTESCYAAALNHFMEGWKNATENCTDSFRIGQTLEALHCVAKTQTQTQTQCNFNMTVHRQFGSFVNATKEFVQKCNSSQ